MNYVNMVKTMVQSGQNYIRNYGKTPHAGRIDKAEVIAAAKSFNDNQLDPRKCQKVLTELICLLNRGQQFTETEIVQLFFSITKLFKSPVGELRRMVYQIIKELKDQPSIYIVTSCLVKDIQDKDNFFKMNALRTIQLVLDQSNLAQIERYILTLIASDNPGVSTAALLSGIQLFSKHEEMVRKWTKEVTERLNSRQPSTKLHALILLFEIRKKDSNAVKKVLYALMKENLTEHCTIQLIRLLATYVEDLDHSSDEASAIINFIIKQVRSNYPSVVLEAAKLACESSLMSNKDLLDVVKILESYLVTTNTVRKYAVLKLYNKLLKNPSRRSLMVNISQIEKVLSDKNRSLSSLAASILLRMCNESQLEKLFQQISESMSEMSDDYKIDVLESIKNVVRQFPGKFELVNSFLLRFMHQERKYDFTKSAVDVMEFEIKQIGGQAKKDCLRILSGFLMTQSFQKIHFQILGIISREVNAVNIDQVLLKHLIGQIYLQDAPIRACSLSTLIKLSHFQSPLKGSINRVIKQFAHDEDEEVRYRSVIETPTQTTSAFEIDLLEAYLQQNLTKLQSSSEASALNWDTIRAWGDEVGLDNIIKPQDEETKKVDLVEAEEQTRFRDIFKNHTTFSKYGPMLRVCPSVLLTEKEAQFQVKLRKFFFKENLVLEYTVTNHTPSAIMEDVRIELKHNSESLNFIHLIPAKEIKPNSTSDIFLGLSMPNDEHFTTATFNSLMKYRMKETQGAKVTQYEDEYPLEDFNLTFTDYMVPQYLPKGSFVQNWDGFQTKEIAATYQLNYPNTQAAAKEIQKHFGLAVCEGEQEDPSKKTNLNTCYLSGSYLGQERVLVICIIGFDTKKGCLMKLRVKCKDEEVGDSIANSVE